MPTFDFFNIVRQIGRVALAAISSPVVVVTTLAGSLAAAVGVYVSFFADLTLPTINLNSLSSDFSFVDNDWADFVCYCLDLSTVSDVFNFVVQLLSSLIPAVITFFVSCFALFWVYKAYSVVRTTIKDVVS